METLTPAKKVTKAKTKLVLDHPFFGAILMRLEVVETPGHPTAWVDGKYLGYNPAFIDSLDLNQTTGLFAHEVMHLAMKHHLRRGDRDPALWRKACDYAINKILKDGGFYLPEGGLLDDAFDNQSAERIYAALEKGAMGNGGDGEGDDAGSGDGQTNPEDDDDDQDDQDQDDQGQPDQQEKEGDEDQEDQGLDQGHGDPDQEDDQEDDQNQGQGPGDGDNPYENAAPVQPDPSVWGDVLDAPVVNTGTEEEIQQEEEDMELAVVNAAQIARAIGNMPGHLMRMVEEARQAKIDWRDELRDFMEQQVCKDDYTFMVPNRRYSGSDVILPSLNDGDGKPHIVVGVDSSGSTLYSPGEIETYAAEISTILEDFDCEFTVIYCDTAVRDVVHLTPDDLPLNLEVPGGGGTTLSPIFDYVVEHEIEHEGIIVFSDMYVYPFGEEPDSPVLWLNTSGDAGRQYAESNGCFGRIIDLDVEVPDA